MQWKLKNRAEENSRKKIKESTSNPFSKESYFVNKRTRTSQATSKNYNLNSYADIPHWSKANSSEEEDIGKNKFKRRSQDGIINKAVKGFSSEEEEIVMRKCSRKT